MIRKIIPKTEFSKNVASVAGGTLLAQLITILLSPVLSRLFTPSEFGIYSIFLNLALTVAVASTLRYELAVMLPQKEDEAINVVALSFLIGLLFSSIVAIVFFAGGHTLLQLIRSDEIEPFIPLVAVYVFFFSIMNTLNYWLSRTKMFTRLSAGKVAQSAITSLASIALFYAGFRSAGLIGGVVMGQAGISILYIIFFRSDWLRLKNMVNRRVMKEMFFRYIHFFSFNTPLAIIGVVQDLIVAGLIKYYFGAAAAGFYFLSYRILKLPAGIVGAATYQVFYQRINELFPDGKAIQYQIKKVYSRLLLISIPVFGVVLLAGPFLFSIVFGAPWRNAGVYSQLMVPTLVLSFVLAPVSAVAVVMRKQQYAIFIGVADIIIRTISVVAGGYFQNVYVALGCLSIFTTIMLLIVMWWYYRLPLSKNVNAY